MQIFRLADVEAAVAGARNEAASIVQICAAAGRPASEAVEYIMAGHRSAEVMRLLEGQEQPLRSSDRPSTGSPTAAPGKTPRTTPTASPRFRPEDIPSRFDHA